MFGGSATAQRWKMDSAIVLPNFMIIGAMRSGTTSLWHYLMEHPEIFMSQVKEPMFFCDRQEQGWRMDGLSWWVETREDYEDLFKAGAGYKAVGEASVLYLHDSGAARRIKEMIPQVRLICSLRDPCDRAFSEYIYRRMRGVETRSSFLEAIRADQKRPQQEKLLYLEQGLYYRHLTRYLEYFPKERLKILFYLDLSSDPGRVMREVFEFLDVDPSVRANTKIRRQAAGLPRYRAISWLLSAQRNPLRRVVASMCGARTAWRLIMG